MLVSSVIQVVGIAVLGWFATILAIKNSSLSASFKQLLMLPSWLPWIALALGAPVISGSLTLSSGLGIGSALTVGLLVSTVMQRPRD